MRMDATVVELDRNIRWLEDDLAMLLRIRAWWVDRQANEAAVAPAGTDTT